MQWLIWEKTDKFLTKQWSKRVLSILDIFSKEGHLNLLCFVFKRCKILIEKTPITYVGQVNVEIFVETISKPMDSSWDLFQITFVEALNYIKRLNNW